MGEPLELLRCKVDLHMRSVLPKIVEDLLAGRAKDVVDLVDLIQLLLSWEKWTEREDLKHHAANAPDVHLVTVVAVGEEALRCPVPPSRDILRQRLILV